MSGKAKATTDYCGIAFTDYRSQGQTVPSVIMDIAKSPTEAGLPLFNLYVALSRSSGRDRIQLMRDFDQELFFKPIDASLVREDKQLAKLNEETRKKWTMGSERYFKS